jgi:propionyl-CoA synthetase
MGYREVYAGWKADPEAYWLQAAQAIDWVKPPSQALNDARAPLYEWYTDATVNTTTAR